MTSEKLKPFDITANDIMTYLKKYADLSETNVDLENNLYNLIASYLNFNKKKSIFGVLNIQDEMYILIYNNNEYKYGAVKIQDNDIYLFYDVIINYDNKKYQSYHEFDKIEEHGFLDIENIYKSLSNSIRDIKFEEIKDGIIQNYFLAYVPIEAVEDNLKIKDTNKNKFRCKYKVPLRLKNNSNYTLEFYIPTAHPLSKDNKKDFIIC